MSHDALLTLLSAQDRSGSLHRGSDGMSKYGTAILRATRNAVIHATLFVARSGLTVFDTAEPHWKSGRRLA